MYANEKLDKVVVPKMRPDKESVFSAEVVEERALPKRNTSQTTAAQTQSWSPALTGVRQVAQRRKEVQFTALLHHISVSLLEQSHYERKSVLNLIENLKTYPWIKSKVDAGELQLHGRWFDLESGVYG